MTRILIVDDEPELLEAWSFALEYVGYDVDRASNGEEALELVRIDMPDLIVTDLMMPGMNGEELCRQVRANPDWQAIPIILHTAAHVAAVSIPRLWDALIRKPARMETFLSTIEILASGGGERT